MFKKSILKKILVFTVLLILGTAGVSFGFPKKARAAGVNISPSSWTVSPSGSVSVTVTVDSPIDIYAYEIHIGGGGALSGGRDDAGGGGGGRSLEFTCSLTAVGTGSGLISVSGSVSDGDSSDAFADAITIAVEPVGDGGNTGGGTGGNAGGADGAGMINGNPVQEGSANANLVALKVIGPEGNEIPLTDNGNYIWSATVPSNVNKVTVEATAEDPKASVEGAGERELQVGENPIDIVVTAENGIQIGYRINLIRKDEHISLMDLAEEIKTFQGDTLTVKLEDGNKLDAALLKTLKGWGKTLILNRYAEDGSVLYSWTIPCAKIPDDMKDFDPAVNFTSHNADTIDALANYASGKYINLAYSGVLPEGTQLTLKNAEEFKEGTPLRLYYYDPKEKVLSLEGEVIKAERDKVVLSLTHASEYFLTRADLSLLNAGKATAPKKDYSKWIMIAEGVVILGLLIALILVATKKKGGGRDDRRRDDRRRDRTGDQKEDYPDDFFERNLADDEPEDADFFETGFDELPVSDITPEAAWDDTPVVLEPYDVRLQEGGSTETPGRPAAEKARSIFREEQPRAAKAGASSLTQALSYIDYGEEKAGKGGASSVTEVLDFIDFGEEEAEKGGASSLTQALNFIDYGQDETK